MKAQTSYPFTMAEAGLTFLLIMGVAYGSQGFTQDFIKQEVADAQTDRVKNAAMAVDSLPQGHLELDLQDYEYRIDGEEFRLSYRDKNHSVDIRGSVTAEQIIGPENYTEMEGLCISKKPVSDEKALNFSSGGC
ncbi:MAG: hypothetical protein ACLFTA_02075 [Candidatus Nanohaloarchaea archaeon]